MVEVPTAPIVHVVPEATLDSTCDNTLSDSIRIGGPPASTPSRPPLAPTASEEASLTEATCSGSALTNHVANISIANNLLSTHDSNLNQQEESSDPDESLLGGAEIGWNGFSPSSFDVYHSIGVENNMNGNNNTHVTTENTLVNGNLNVNQACTGSNEEATSSLHLLNHHQQQQQNHNYHQPQQQQQPPQQRRQNDADNMAATERLRFHERAGILVRLSAGGRTAERKRPLDEFNNGVVMSNRALRINELFEVVRSALMKDFLLSVCCQQFAVFAMRFIYNFSS